MKLWKKEANHKRHRISVKLHFPVVPCRGDQDRLGKRGQFRVDDYLENVGTSFQRARRNFLSLSFSLFSSTSNSRSIRSLAKNTVVFPFIPSSSSISLSPANERLIGCQVTRASPFALQVFPRTLLRTESRSTRSAPRAPISRTVQQPRRKSYSITHGCVTHLTRRI